MRRYGCGTTGSGRSGERYGWGWNPCWSSHSVTTTSLPYTPADSPTYLTSTNCGSTLTDSTPCHVICSVKVKVNTLVITIHKKVDIFLFFEQFLEDISPFCGVIDTPCFGLLVMSVLGFKSRGDSLTCMVCRLWSLDSSDLSLVQHLLTSLWPAWRLSHFDPCTCEQALVGLQIRS